MHPKKEGGLKSPAAPKAPIKLNLLSKTKEFRFKCELCDHVGSLQCATCRVTYYCCPEHLEMDRELHLDLCTRIKALRRPIEFSPQRETRERWVKQRKILMEDMYYYTCMKGQTAMEEGKYDKAIPAATVSAKYAQELFGNTPEVITPLLITAECYINKGTLSIADGFLARALSIEHEAEDVKPSIKARIRRNEGLLHIAKSNFEEALECFAEEIYQNTLEFGPTHIRTSGGYCYLGYMFHLKEKFETAASLFRQTVDIWISCLEPIIQEITLQPDVPVLAGVKHSEKQWMDHCDMFLGLKLLTKCYSHMMEITGDSVKPVDLIKTCYAISALLYIGERYSEARTRAVEGLVRCKTDKLKVLPIHKQVTNMIKYCDRKLFKEDKMAAQEASSSSLLSGEKQAE